MEILLICSGIISILAFILICLCCVLSGRQSRLEERRQLISHAPPQPPVPPREDWKPRAKKISRFS